MKKILIIEDDKELQSICQERLKEEGFEVSSAYVGDKGIHMAKTLNPDLIILDIMLPDGLNGFDVLEQFKRSESLKKIPVIILTNLDSEEKVARDIGVSDYLVKANTSIDELINKVKKVIEKN